MESFHDQDYVDNVINEIGEWIIRINWKAHVGIEMYQTEIRDEGDFL